MRFPFALLAVAAISFSALASALAQEDDCQAEWDRTYAAWQQAVIDADLAAFNSEQACKRGNRSLAYQREDVALEYLDTALTLWAQLWVMAVGNLDKCAGHHFPEPARTDWWDHGFYRIDGEYAVFHMRTCD